MRSAIARWLFVHRNSRLLVLHSVWCLLAIVTGSLFPLWVLVIGPMIYGVPHLVASLRYFAVGPLGSPGVKSISQATKNSRRRIYVAVSVLAISVGLLRIFSTFGENPHLQSWIGVNSLEVTFSVCVALVTALIIGLKRGSVFLKLILLAPLIIFSIWQPFVTVGALILVHNFVGYFYWLASTKAASDRLSAIVSFGIFCFVNLALFMGAFDTLLAALPSMHQLPLAHLNVHLLGASILPLSHDPMLWHRAVVAYAFGQSMHYFVWLKAIPEQNLSRPAPVTFRQSLSLLKNDFGERGVRVLLASVVGISMIWLVFSVPTARSIYFSLAGFHGYLELAGIVFLVRAPSFFRSLRTVGIRRAAPPIRANALQ